MEEKKLSEHESLLIIHQMIQTAKQEQKDDGLGWIIWGWLLFLASAVSFVNLKTQWFSAFFFWSFIGMASIVFLLFSIVRHLFFKKKERVKTYTGDLFEKLNIGFFICLIFIILSMNLGVAPVKGFALLINLYGFWILIYGTALNFRPSVIAAFVTWAIGFAALYVNDFQWTMLLHGLAVLCGYIIPGHIANNEFKKIHRTINE